MECIIIVGDYDITWEEASLGVVYLCVFIFGVVDSHIDSQRLLLLGIGSSEHYILFSIMNFFYIMTKV